MPASNMTGVRSWSFGTGDGSIFFTDTDFRVIPSFETSGGQAVFKLTLRACWEHSDFSNVGLARRQYLEQRLRFLGHSPFLNRLGILTVDGSVLDGFGAPDDDDRPRWRFLGMTFTGDERSNELIIYDANFEAAIAGSDGSPLRSMLFEPLDHDGWNLQCLSQRFMVIPDKEDKTVFTEVFRNAPVRVRGSLGMTTLKFTGCFLAIPGTTVLARAENKDLAMFNLARLKGERGNLYVNTSSYGVAHCKNVSFTQTGFPDGLFFDLEFLTGWIDI